MECTVQTLQSRPHTVPRFLHMLIENIRAAFKNGLLYAADACRWCGSQLVANDATAGSMFTLPVPFKTLFCFGLFGFSRLVVPKLPSPLDSWRGVSRCNTLNDFIFLTTISNVRIQRLTLLNTPLSLLLSRISITFFTWNKSNYCDFLVFPFNGLKRTTHNSYMALCGMDA